MPNLEDIVLREMLAQTIRAAHYLWLGETLESAKQVNPEYLRGQVELISDTFGRVINPELDLDSDGRRPIIERLIFQDPTV